MTEATTSPPTSILYDPDASQAELWAGLARSHSARIAARVRGGDLQGALDLYGHAERLYAVARWYCAGRPVTGDHLADAWTSMEFYGPGRAPAWENRRHYPTAAAAWLPLWSAIARPVGRVEYPAGTHLPDDDPLAIYRGQATAEEPTGISWTLSQERAHWFATTVPRVGSRPGVVLSGRVARDAVLGYLTDRNEDEVIVDPDDVQILFVEDVRP